MSECVVATAKRVCFFAHYDRFGQVADHVLLYLDALADAGFTVVVVSTADLDHSSATRLAAHCHTLMMRENVGLDFGSWADALARFPHLRAELLLLTNDSVYAPVTPLGPFLERLLSVPADVYGAVESLEHASHLQSWFVLMRPAAYDDGAFRDFMAQAIDPHLDKDALVVAREVGLTRMFDAAGLLRHAAFSPARSGPILLRRPLNPTHLLWRSLIERWGLPFIKVDLLRLNPVRLSSVGEWAQVVEPRNPALAAAIRRDLARFVTPAAGSLRARLSWSANRYPTYWPEMQGFVRRDDRWAGRPFAAGLNAGLYLVVESFGRVGRKLVRTARARRYSRNEADVSARRTP